MGCHPTAAEWDGILPLGWANLVVSLLFQTAFFEVDWVSIRSSKANFSS